MEPLHSPANIAAPPLSDKIAVTSDWKSDMTSLPASSTAPLREITSRSVRLSVRRRTVKLNSPRSEPP